MKANPRSSVIVRNVVSLCASTMGRATAIAVAAFLVVATVQAEQVAAPIIEPIPTAQQMIDGFSPVPPGSGNPPVTLTMTSATEGATIYYIIRDNNLISVFPTYLPPYDPANKPKIGKAGTSWVGAMAVKAGMDNSEVVWQEYKVHMPVIELVGSVIFGNVAINTTSEKQFSIYNRGDMDMTISSIKVETDDPGAWSHNFTGPVVVLPSHVIYLKVTFAPTEVKPYSLSLTIESDAAAGSNIRNSSGTGFDPTKVGALTIRASMGEPYFAPAEIQIYCSTSGASLHYTIDASEPTEASTLYDPLNKPKLTTLGEVVVKARGFKDGLTPSEIVSETFNVMERELTATDNFFFDPPVKIGEYMDKPLVLENVGSRAIEISLIAVEDENFGVPDWAGPVTLPVGGSKTYAIRFAPMEIPGHFATLTISTNANGGNLERYLNGNALASDYGVDPAAKTIGSEGGVYVVYVSLGGEWTASEELDWVSIVAKPSLGDVAVTVAANTTGEVRQGTITIAGKAHTVTQLAAEADQVGAPVFLPDSSTGPFVGSVSVSLSTPTQGASVRYAFDENAPSETWTLFVPGTPIVLNETKTIWAYGSKDGMANSPTVSSTYTVEAAMEQVGPPEFSPDPGSGPFSGTIQITLSTPEGAMVYYHWNPNAPKESWYQFGAGLHIEVSQTSTFYAYAKKGGFTDSEVVSATFTFETGSDVVTRPTLNPEAAETHFIGPVEVTFASTTEGASFRYSRMESESIEEWATGGSATLYYPGPLWVQAFKEGLADSEAVSALYRIRASYTGTVVLGEFGVATWTLFLEADGVGLLIVEPLEGAPLVFDILIGADGSISATQKEMEGGGTGGLMAAASADFTTSALNYGEIDASIGPDGSISGELGGLGSIVGAVDPVTDEGRSMCGFYRINQLYADAGECYVIVGTDGKVTMVIVTPDGMDACEGEMDAGGHVVMTTAMDGEADLQIGSDRRVTVALTPQGASEPIEFAGLGAAVTGSNRLVNLSTRGWVGTQSQRLIAGFVIKGAGKKPVLIRAMGPALVGDPLNVPGAIEDPQIEVIPLGSTVPIEMNNDWGEVANLQDLLDAMTVTGAFAAASGSKDAMILTELDPGNYTAKISGVGGMTGVSIVEVYTVEDLDTPEARQVNISTRAFVGTGGSIMILGLKADGNTPRQFLIRAVGPSLGLDPFNLTGVLEDPTVRVVRSSDNVVVATNDDWDEPVSGDTIHAMAQQLGAFALPRGSKDAVVLISLPTDSGFTVKVAGKNGASGVAIAEVYEVP